jgi:hypothetical protein
VVRSGPGGPIFADAFYVTGRKSICDAAKFVQKSSKTSPTEDIE